MSEMQFMFRISEVNVSDMTFRISRPGKNKQIRKFLAGNLGILTEKIKNLYTQEICHSGGKFGETGSL